MVPPKVVTAIETVEALVGETVKFFCKAKGSPEPKLTWFKDDKPILRGENSRCAITNNNLISGDSRSSLVIVDVTLEDDGTYSCEAVNEAGTDRCKAELFVDG